MLIDEELRRLAERLSERSAAIAASIQDRELSQVPEYFEGGDPALLDMDRRTIASALRDIFAGLAHGRTPPETAPGAFVEEARLAAQAGVDLQVLLRTHRIGHGVAWEAILRLAEETIADADTRLAVLTLASRYQFEWNDRVITTIVGVYERERDLLIRDRERRKRELVRDLLGGLPVDLGQLTYDVFGDHLAVVAWGAAPDSAVAQLASRLDGKSLVVTATAGALYAWIASPDVTETSRSPVAQFEPPAETWLAVGSPGSGVDGFRASHRQALQAYRVARVRQEPVTRYSDVALEALAVRDLALTRDFVDHFLGAVASDDLRDEVLRQTLSAYFRTGQNASSAAHLLGVHERTVAYRLRAIERRLGAPIAARREELAVALRLLDLLHRLEPAPSWDDHVFVPALE